MADIKRENAALILIQTGISQLQKKIKEEDYAE